MAAGNWTFYRPAYLDIMQGDIDLDNDSFRMVLLTASYTPANTHSAWSDLSAAEASGTGYTAGGEAVTVTVTESGGTINVDSGDVSWASSTITAKYAAIVRDADGNGSLAAGDIPLCYVDLDTGGGSLSTTSGTFSVTVSDYVNVNIPDGV